MADTTVAAITEGTADIGMVATMVGTEVIGVIPATVGVTRITVMDGDSALGLAGRIRIRRPILTGTVTAAERLIRRRLATILHAIIATSVSAQGKTVTAIPRVMLRRRRTWFRGRPLRRMPR